MATIKEELEKHLSIALQEIGEITPWYQEDVGCWIFEHVNYPVSCGENTPEAVKEKYPLYLKEFLLHRLQDRLDPLTEKAVKGRGGARKGAGRPKKEEKTRTKTIRLPENLYGAAMWLRKHPEALPEIHKIMARFN